MVKEKKINNRLVKKKYIEHIGYYYSQIIIIGYKNRIIEQSKKKIS